MRFLCLFVILFVANVTAFAASFDPPKRKSGLWEITIATEQAKGGYTVRQCVDENTDDLMKGTGPQAEKSNCSKKEMRKEGDRIVSESVCKLRDSTETTRAVFSGRFDSAYQADIKSTYEPPMSGIREASTRIEAKWLSPCNPGQKGGDISIPGMPNFNIQEMMKGMPTR